MKKHIEILGTLNIVWGSLHVFGALIIMLVFGGVAGFIGAVSHEPDARFIMPLIGLFGGALAILLLMVSIPSIIAGIGLLKLASWSRTLGIVVSALHLLSIPFGTALGIYGLWVLLSNETPPIFEQTKQAIRI